MTDYSQMSDGELNRRVLMHLGYRAVNDSKVWSIADPNGELMGAYRTEESAWNSQRHLEWATNLNAAAALDFGEHTLTITLEGNEARVNVSDPLAFTVADATLPHEKLARAICEAWLMYGDAVGAKGE